MDDRDRRPRRPGRARPDLAAVVLGIGLGGFVDGIVLHQLMGWHHMLSGWYPHDPGRNLIGDGLFHLACLLVVVLGVVLLNGRPPLPGRRLWGGIVLGWGAFDVVEGVVDHLLLGVHHVREGHPQQLAHDLGFLGLGLALVVAGLALAAGPARRRTRA
ncbi:MAG TPA: DUF2243 domain-containing protein [Pseudonocardiaceae bacterium]